VTAGALPFPIELGQNDFARAKPETAFTYSGNTPYALFRKYRGYSEIGKGRVPCACEPNMQDFMMLLFTAVFFALAFLYVKACQKLR